jgi:hypothetical protein
MDKKQPIIPNIITEENDPIYGTPDLSLRAYAAIKLKQPDSGIDWIDEMILKAKRDEVAAKAREFYQTLKSIKYEPPDKMTQR